MTKVYISNVGMTKFGRWEEPLEILIEQAINNFYQYDNSQKFDLNAIFFGAMNTDEFINAGNYSTVVADHLALTPVPAVRIETASSTGAAVFHMGVLAVASGIYDNVLVIAGEKMTANDTPKTTEVLAKVISDNERTYGATMPALAALITQRYMHDYGLSRDTLSEVAVKNHYNGSLNPFAHFQKEITVEKASTSKFVAEPLRLFDCSPISDGAAAVLLTSKPTDVNVAGIGQATDRMELRFRRSMTSFESTKKAAESAYKNSKLTPDQISIAELHDAFTPFELISAEDVGFYKPGGAISALEAGETELNGVRPINTSGGLKARGHPVGVSGLAQIIELVWQLRSEAGKRQIDNVVSGLAQSTGGIANNNLVTILKKIDK
ncbi:MAG: thiolase domain-containing protein [Thermoplasmata archaeon]|nr:MAG: thiolase domain-containing protein [Thermoplasmata archaeon]